MNKAWVVNRLKKLGSTQTDLATAMGLYPSGLTKIFNGERELKAKEAGRMAGFLKVSTSQLYQDLGIENGKYGMEEGSPAFFQSSQKTLLKEIIAALQGVYEKNHYPIKADQLFETALAHYEKIIETTQDPAEQKGAIKMLVKQLEVDLSTKNKS